MKQAIETIPIVQAVRQETRLPHPQFFPVRKVKRGSKLWGWGGESVRSPKGYHSLNLVTRF